MEYLLLVGGLAILIFGAELLVKGAVEIALRLKVSMLVIGMTIVSFGTSAPELLVSVQAVLEGHQDISIGAVIGSNISNIALILGLTALVLPITVKKDSIRIDWPMMMLATLGFYLLSLDNWLSFWEGGLFVFVLFVFGYWLIKQSRKKNQEKTAVSAVSTKETKVFNGIVKNIFFIVLGCFCLVYGSDFLLDGAVQIARNFHLSERIIGITIIAFGTSVPELSTSIVAAYRGKSDISVGNLIGSNLFNILAILGITAMVKDIHVSDKVLQFDMYWLLGISLIIFPLMIFGSKVSRIKGLFLLLVYMLYIFLVVR